MPLNEARRAQLDGIVQQMAANGEPDEAVQFVVNDFKTKYEGVSDTASSPEQQQQDIATQQGTASLIDVAKGIGKSALNTVYQGGDLIRRGLGMERIVDTPAVQAVTQPANPAQSLGRTVETAAEMLPVASAGIRAAKATPGLVARGLGISKTRAVANLESAAKAAKDVIVDVNAPGEAAIRIMGLRDTGAKGVPMVVNRFVQRITDPAKGPVTFEEARKFYSNLSRLSVNERNAMNGTVKYEVGGLVRALSDEITKAAGAVGKADDYTAGVSEYARYAKAKAKAPKVAKIAAGAAGGAAALAATQRLVGHQ